VDQPFFVCVGQGVTQSNENLEQLVEVLARTRLGLQAVQPLSQRLAGHEFHGEVQLTLDVRAEFVDGHDPGVIQFRDAARLLEQRATHPRLPRRIATRALERDRSVEVRVPSPTYLGHAPAPDQLLFDESPFVPNDEVVGLLRHGQARTVDQYNETPISGRRRPDPATRRGSPG
jgi:hypothetical protein